MAIRISSAPVDRSLIMLRIRNIGLRENIGIVSGLFSIGLAVVLTAPAWAQEKNGFFQKNYAEDIVEIDPNGSALFDAPSSNKNAPKTRDFQDRMEEYQAALEEKLAEQKAINAAKIESLSKEKGYRRERPNAVSGERKLQTGASRSQFSDMGSEKLEAEASESEEAVSQTTEDEESQAAFEPINPKDYKKVVIDMVISATPSEHFFEQIRRGGEVSKIKGVEIGAVTVIGQPNLSIEFVEALKSFKAAEGKMTFGAQPPDGLNAKNSPTWVLNLDGRRVVFEGEFSIDEVFERR